MPADPPGSRESRENRPDGSAAGISPVRIALLFAVFGTVWILATDFWAFRVLGDWEGLRLLGSVKGLLFVAVSALVVYLLLRHELRRRRGSEAALEASRETLSRIFGSLDDAILVVETGGRTIVDCNPAAERMFGYRRDELVGRSTRILHRDEESYREFDRLGADAVRRGGVFRTEYSLRRKDGEVFDTEHTVVLFGSRKDRALSIVRDISERRCRRRELEESRALLRRVLATAVDGVLYLDPDGRVVFANAAAERISGRTPLEGLRFDDPSWDVRDTEGRLLQEHERPVHRTLASGEVIQGAELVYRRDDGRELYLSINAAPVERPEGERAGAVVTYRDVTERRAAEEVLERTEGLLVRAQKMEAIGRLAGGVAHDFNNLLTAVLGYCELAVARIRAGESAEAEVAEIRRGAERAAQLTAQLLAFSRQQVREPRALDANRVLEELAGMLRVVVGEAVSLELRPAPEPVHVVIDPGQLEQVVLNLVLNARDALSDGGRVVVESRRLELREPLPAADAEIPPGEYALLAVSDTGGGVPPGDLERLFEPFFTTKPAGQGTGLGLATVYGIVSQNEGHVRVESEPGEGARFEVYLPRVPADAAVEPAGADEDEEPVRGSETVLVVEDEELVRDLVVAVLRGQGYGVLEAVDGEDALARLDEGGPPPDLLLTDVVLPGMDGRKLASRVTERLPGLPVLFMSGYGETVVSRKGLVEEGVELLQKPFAPADLAARVRELLDSRGSTSGGGVPRPTTPDHDASHRGARRRGARGWERDRE